MQAEPAACEGRMWAQKPGGQAELCGSRHRVTWSPAFSKYLCDECRWVATTMALHGLSPEAWVRAHPSSPTVRVG